MPLTNASYSALNSSFTTASGLPLYVNLGIPTFKKQVTEKIWRGYRKGYLRGGPGVWSKRMFSQPDY
jgi:hypothetical protein